MPQAKMMDSTVLPMSSQQARVELTEFLRKNVPDWPIPSADDRLVFEGWATLCDRFAPVFLEKSPHHLHSPSALALFQQASTEVSRELDIRVIGLVRNPIDTLYSMWQRWRTRPELRQHEWVAAYQNLRSLSAIMGDRMTTIRYEDLVQDPSKLGEICDFLEVDRMESIGSGVRSGSVSSWTDDRTFGFQPDKAVIELARSFGYDEADLRPRQSPVWAIAREIRIAQRKARGLAGRARRSLRSKDGE